MTKKFLAAVPIALLFAATPAYAANPLIGWGVIEVKSDGVVQGQAKGTYTISSLSDGTKARFGIQLLDKKPGGEAIYTKHEYQWDGVYCVYVGNSTWDCPSGWHTSGTDDSINYSGGTWSSTNSEVQDVDSGSDIGRGKVKVCENQNFSPDDCNSWTYTLALKY